MPSHERARWARDLRRVRLCDHGPTCVYPDCSFAHALRDLLPPQEIHAEYPIVWTEVDRWFGQTMTKGQLERIRRYHSVTPFYEVPLWTYGLRFATEGKKYPGDIHRPWDYGLEGDCQLLCRDRRSGRSPFSFMPKLWENLAMRKEELSQWSAVAM